MMIDEIMVQKTYVPEFGGDFYLVSIPYCYIWAGFKSFYLWEENLIIPATKDAIGWACCLDDSDLDSLLGILDELRVPVRVIYV